MENWDDRNYMESCANQSGCTNCDNDESGSWCYPTNNECTTVIRDENGMSEEWFYCDIETIPDSTTLQTGTAIFFFFFLKNV